MWILTACAEPSTPPEAPDASDTATDTADTADSARETGAGETGGDSLETGSLPSLAPVLWPEAPYPDSALRAGVEAGTLTSCRWFVGGVEIGSACAVLGEDLGLQAGDALVLEVEGVTAEGDPAAGAAGPFTVRPRPDLLVTEATAGRVALIDGDTRQVASTVSVGSGFPLPIGVAARADGAAAWVTTHLGGSVRRLEPTPWAEVASASLDTQLYWIALDEARDRLLVADQGASAIGALDADTLEPTASFALSSSPVSVRVDGDIAWVAARAATSPTGHTTAAPTPGLLARLDLAADTLDTVELGEEPYWAEPSPGGDEVAVADEPAGEVIVVDAGSLEPTRVLTVGGAPTGVAWHPLDRRLYVALYTEGQVVELDADSGEVLRTWDAGDGAVGVFPRDDGRFLFVPALHANRLVVIDLEQDAQPFAIDGVSGPRAVAFVPGG